jgi:flagellar basal body-associated protein FliL
MRKHKSPFQDENDFIALWLMGALLIIFLAILFANSFIAMAYTASTWVTKEQITQAEKDGAIKRTQLEVVNNYGEQETIDANQLQGAKND